MNKGELVSKKRKSISGKDLEPRPYFLRKSLLGIELGVIGSWHEEPWIGVTSFLAYPDYLSYYFYLS